MSSQLTWDAFLPTVDDSALDPSFVKEAANLFTDLGAASPQAAEGMVEKAVAGSPAAAAFCKRALRTLDALGNAKRARLGGDNRQQPAASALQQTANIYSPLALLGSSSQ